MNAQFDSEGDVASQFRPGSMWYFSGFRPAKSDKIHKYDRLIFDFTYNDWNGDLKPFDNKWNSFGMNTNLMFDIPLNKKNTLAFGTGLSHTVYSICHFNRFEADSTNRYTSYSINDQNDPVRKRTLIGNSISVPLELRFRSESWKHFKVHIGGKIGYQLNLYERAVTDGQSGKMVVKDHNYPDVNRLVYGAYFRIGVRNWALYGAYNLNTLFSNEKSTQLNILQMGISLSLF